MRRFAALAAFCLLAAAQEQAERYYIVLLRPDPARKTLTQEESGRLKTAHLANVRKMSEDGVLVAAGPFEETPVTITGIFVFRVASMKAAEALASKDPMVAWHRNTADAHAWMGPPGIGDEYARLHKQDPNAPDKMVAHPLFLVYRGPKWAEKGTAPGSLMTLHAADMTRHAAYIGELRQRGKLGAAGWVEGEGNLVGMVIFKPIPREEAEALIKDDPAVRAGTLRVETHNWWSDDRALPW